MLGSVPGLGFAPSAPAASTSSMAPAPAKSGGMGFLLPLAAVVAVGALAYWMFTRGSTPPAAPFPTSPTIATPEVEKQGGEPDITDPTVIAINTAKGSITSLTSELGKITDVASAEAALPRLKEIAGGVDKLDGLAKLIPADAKASFTSTLKPLIDPIKANVDKLYAIPGVGDKLKPILDPIVTKLAALVG
jgi:hypothetical protein